MLIIVIKCENEEFNIFTIRGEINMVKESTNESEKRKKHRKKR